MITKRIVLLANSRKHAERCLAGIDLHNETENNWIRPVSSRAGEGLNEHERQYQGSIEPAVLDVVDVPLIGANPHACQRENWLAAASEYWIKRGILSWDQTVALAKAPSILWKNGHSTYNGLNDEIPAELAQAMSYSICLVHAQSVEIRVLKDYSGRKKVYAVFKHSSVTYQLSVTDSVWEPIFKDKQLGDYSLGECLLTVSISEPFTKSDGKQCQYKLIAAIIPKNSESP